MKTSSGTRRTLQRIDGYVWCEQSGEVHQDSLDPYEYGAPDTGEEDSRCQRENHFSLYARLVCDPLAPARAEKE